MSEKNRSSERENIGKYHIASLTIHSVQSLGIVIKP